MCGSPGSGKTSLFSTAAGLTPPVSGALRLFGQRYWAASEAEQVALRRRIGFVFDGGGRLFAHMDVLDNLVLPIQYHTDCRAEEARKRALEMLTTLGLERLADRPPSRLSAADQRKIALARTLTAPVEVLFLDAPIAGLGPRDARWWLDLLRGLLERSEERGEDLSVVVSGYDVHRWLGWADRFGLVGDGIFRPVTEDEARAQAGVDEESLAGPGGP